MATRDVAINDDWLAVVPYWASWPYEILLLPALRRAAPKRAQPSPARYPRRISLKISPLSTTICSAPVSPIRWAGTARRLQRSCQHWQLHAHFYPPLLRSASVRKFMVGYEMLAEAQRDLTPEAAAAKLREQSETHYRSFS